MRRLIWVELIIDALAKERTTLAGMLEARHHFVAYGFVARTAFLRGHAPGLPKPPAGAAICRIDVIICVGRDPAPAAD